MRQTLVCFGLLIDCILSTYNGTASKLTEWHIDQKGPNIFSNANYYWMYGPIDRDMCGGMGMFWTSGQAVVWLYQQIYLINNTVIVLLFDLKSFLTWSTGVTVSPRLQCDCLISKVQ